MAVYDPITRKAQELKYLISTCNSRINSFKTSLTQANSLVETLKSENTQLVTAQDNLKKYFTVNGKTADNGRIEKIRDKVQQITKKMTSTIIPEINNQINTQTRNRNSYQSQLNKLRRENPELKI